MIGCIQSIVFSTFARALVESKIDFSHFQQHCTPTVAAAAVDAAAVAAAAALVSFLGPIIFIAIKLSSFGSRSFFR